MAGLLPQMSLEPAPGYRRFVECHFEALRRDARRLAGDGPGVDEVCTAVLADVALRWRWFELLRVWLRWSDPAGEYLDGALARRAARWRPAAPETAGDAPPEIEVEVLPAGADDPWTARWDPDRYVVDAYPPASGTPTDLAVPARPAAPVATSAAVRIAAVRPVEPPPSADVDAVIAWLHAHETYERYRRVVAATAAAVAVSVLFRL